MRTDLRGQVRAAVMGVLSLVPERPFAVRLPDGSTIPPSPPAEEPRFTLWLKRPRALRRMFLPPSELALGEGYIFDDYDIEGDIVAAFRFLEDADIRFPGPLKSLRLAWKLLRLERTGSRGEQDDEFAPYAEEGRLHNPDRDQRASQFHYDLSNAFYKLWLDERMVYSCAYFADEDDVLDQAQERKLDRICRKLDLQPGDRLLDIGCGFGGLIIHAAANYEVEATGISVSEAQTAEARGRVEALGLSDRCRIIVQHYEEYQPDRPYDRLSSVGMLGHVGQEKMGTYFAKAYALLRPGGLFLLQGGAAQVDRTHVGRRWMDRLGRGRNAFMQKYSFPDSRLIDIPTVLLAAEKAGFETRDVESLREHYPLTLQHWLARLETNREAAVEEVGQAAYRAWRLVLAGYLILLQQGKLGEYQSLLSKPGTDGQSELALQRES